jgi:transposase
MREVPAVEEPHEVQADEEHERVWERVAAVDIAKASGVVCTRLPDEDRPGRRKAHLRAVQATAKAVTGPGDCLRARQVQVVTLEPASDYRRAWFAAPEAAGLKVQLVSARPVKNAPGRARTGKKDAAWLARLTEKGLLQPSFVPPCEIRRLRELTRLRAGLAHGKSRYRARPGKLLERALVKVSAVLPALDTGTARAMTGALIAGQRDPKALADLAVGEARAERAGLAAALDGRREDHHSVQARILLDDTGALNRQTGQLTAQVSELISQIPAAWGTGADGAAGPRAGASPDSPVLPAAARPARSPAAGSSPPRRSSPGPARA